LGGACSNRAFQKLEQKRGLNELGVKCVPIPKRGLGIKATNCFEPGSLILEYTGDVITHRRAFDRTMKLYKNNSVIIPPDTNHLNLLMILVQLSDELLLGLDYRCYQG
jgi:hypothetical protein